MARIAKAYTGFKGPFDPELVHLSALQKAVILQQLSDESRAEELLHKKARADAEGKDVYVTYDSDDPDEADIVEIMALYMPGWSKRSEVDELKRRAFLGGTGE